MGLCFVKTVGVCDFANGEVCEPKPKLFASDEVGSCDGLCEASPLKVDLDAGVEAEPCFVCARDNVIVVVRCSGLSCKVVDWVRFNKKYGLPVNGVYGHCLDEVCAVKLLPDRDDDKFSKVKVGRRANKFGDGSKRWREVFHDSSDVGVSDDFKLFVVRDGTNCFRKGLSDEKVGSNLN